MIVYVVLWSFPFEGDSLCGVFSTRELAEQFIATQSDAADLHVEEWEVDSPPLARGSTEAKS